MKVLILHMRFHPDLTGTGPLVTDLATFLSKCGDDVTVVTSMPHYGRREIPKRYRGRLMVRERFQGVDLWRTFVYVPPNPKGFHRSLNYLSYNFMSILAGGLAGKPDVILCINPPITVGFSGWLLKLMKNAPLIYNVQDIWPDCIILIGQLRNPLLIRTFRYLEKFIYRVSAGITVLSKGMQQNLLEKGVPQEKIKIIPNWVNIEDIHPMPRENPFRFTHHLTGRFVVLFAGNIGFNSMLESVLDSAALLQNDPKYHFLIVGEGNAKAGLVKYADQLELKNVKFLTTQPKSVLPQMLAAADVSLVTLNHSIGALNVPSKTFSIMASGRPVIASVPENSEISHLVKRANSGLRMAPENPRAMAHAIKKLAGHPDLAREYGDSGRHYMDAHFKRDEILAEYRELLLECTQLS